jgi:hypothetical protein
VQFACSRFEHFAALPHVSGHHPPKACGQLLDAFLPSGMHRRGLHAGETNRQPIEG